MNKNLKEYIEEMKKNETMPYLEDYQVWLFENKGISLEAEIDDRDIGILRTYNKRFLLNKASAGGRNSQNYVLLLKDFKEDNKNAGQAPIKIEFTNTSKLKLDTKKKVEKKNAPK